MSNDHNEKLEIHMFDFSESQVPKRAECRALVEHTLKRFLKATIKPQLNFDTFGRPTVNNPVPLNFSYAHSRTSLVVAISDSTNSIGVDTEPVSRLDDLVGLKEVAFSPTENRQLHNDEYVAAWCRKEAALKQLGKGFRDNDPAEVTVKTNKDSSYKLYLGGRKRQAGFFFNITVANNVIAVCADKPMKNLLLHRYLINEFA